MENWKTPIGFVVIRIDVIRPNRSRETFCRRHLRLLLDDIAWSSNVLMLLQALHATIKYQYYCCTSIHDNIGVFGTGLRLVSPLVVLSTKAVLPSLAEPV